jgi:hypothetical protein
MTNFNQIVELARTLTVQAESYAARPTKAESARMRKTINELKKLATPTKAELVEADKA